MKITGRISTGFNKSKHAVAAVMSAAAFLFVVIISVSWSSSRSGLDLEISESTIVPKQEFSKIISGIITGKSISKIDLDTIENALLKHPYIKSCDVFYDGRSKVLIEPEVRIPVASAVIDGEVKYIDDEGYLLPKDNIIARNDLIFITNIDKKDKKQFKKAVQIVMILNDRFDQMNGFISEIRYDGSINGFELLLTTDEYRVVIGETDMLEEKLSMLKLLIEEKNKFAESGNVIYADLRFKERIIIKKN